MQIRIRLLASLLLMGFGATAVVPVAQEAPPPQPAEREQAPAPAEDEQAPAPAEREPAPAPAERPETPAPPSEEAAAQGDEEWEMPTLPDDLLGDDVFIPSEEIEADEEVTFPVNI